MTQNQGFLLSPRLGIVRCVDTVAQAGRGGARGECGEQTIDPGSIEGPKRSNRYRTEELLRQFSGRSQFLERAVASRTLSSSLAAT